MSTASLLLYEAAHSQALGTRIHGSLGLLLYLVAAGALSPEHWSHWSSGLPGVPTGMYLGLSTTPSEPALLSFGNGDPEGLLT